MVASSVYVKCHMTSHKQPSAFDSLYRSSSNPPGHVVDPTAPTCPVKFVGEPLLVLSAGAGQVENSMGSGGLSERTLHCCYTLVSHPATTSCSASQPVPADPAAFRLAPLLHATSTAPTPHSTAPSRMSLQETAAVISSSIRTRQATPATPSGDTEAAEGNKGEETRSQTTWLVMGWTDSRGELLGSHAEELQQDEVASRVMSHSMQAWMWLTGAAHGYTRLSRLVVCRLDDFGEGEEEQWLRQLQSGEGLRMGQRGEYVGGMAVGSVKCAPLQRICTSWENEHSGPYLLLHDCPDPLGADGKPRSTEPSHRASIVWTPMASMSGGVLPADLDVVRQLDIHMIGSQEYLPSADGKMVRMQDVQLPKPPTLSRIPLPTPLDSAASSQLPSGTGGSRGRDGCLAAALSSHLKGVANDEHWMAAIRFAAEYHALGTLSAVYHGLITKQPATAGDTGLGWWGWPAADAHLPLHCHAVQWLAELITLQLSGTAHAGLT